MSRHSAIRAIALATLSILCATAAQAQTAMKISISIAQNSHQGAAIDAFAKSVEQRTGGRYKIQTFYSGALGAERESVEATQLGTQELTFTSTGPVPNFVPEVKILDVPFLFRDYAHARGTLDGPIGQEMLAKFEAKGLKALAWGENGFRHMTNSKRPIQTPADVKGLKIRVPPEVQLEAAMEAAGANATKIAFPELYMALSQGVVDGEENPIAVITHNKFYEVQKHLALTRHAYNSMVHVISAKTWARLTPEQQTIIREESKAAGAMMRKTIAAEEDAQITKLQSLGMQVTRPDPAAFRAVMGPAYQRIGTYAGEANVQKFMAMVDAERKK